jgi:hypothetical protein
MKARGLILLATLSALLILPANAPADFGIEPGSLSMRAVERDGTPDSRAGSHPYAFNLRFKLNTEASGETEGGAMRNFTFDFSPGFVGNPQAVAPLCPRPLFEGFLPNCPSSTQVGVGRAIVPGLGEAHGPLYNLVPPPGVAAQLGFSTAGLTILPTASVRSEEGYGLHVDNLDIPLEASEVRATIWGNPADPHHDPERGQKNGEESAGAENAYFTLPTSCGAAPTVTLKADSALAPGVFDTQTAALSGPSGETLALNGCESVPFSPSIASQPTSELASNPSGLEFELTLPNQGLLAPNGTAESQPRKTVVTLPEGMSVNPSFAEGAGVCTEAQYRSEQIDTGPGEGCPQASKLGSVEAQTPLLEESLTGALYLAAPYENEFGTLAALYIVARVPERGVLVKQAGKVEFDPNTGQITSTFEDLPPVPFSSFKLHFREGARAPLVTPPACGEYQTLARLTPFSSEAASLKSASFKVTHGPDGGPCPSGGLPPFKPGLIAGTLNNAAGRFSPFNVRLFRTDAEQEINRFSIKLPPGIVGKLAGIPFCSDAAIAQAKARTGIHGGQEELESPSCPAASEIGHSLAGAGVGQVLAYAPGKLYLAGPYHGSAISLVAITAAKVGPFDLGTVVIRQAFKVDPETGEVFIDATGSDPIPHIIKGVPVHLRDIRAYTDRPEFVLNPTSCKRTSTASTLLGSGLDFASEADDRPVTVSTPFQAADCAALPFKPRLSLKLKGGTRRGDYPALTARLKMSGFGEAGIRRAQVTLPPSEFIANAHFNTICTRVQFKQGTHPGELCPAGSIYGSAKAVTPILSEPLEGPVFLRSSEHQLPDVVASLHNGEIDVVLVGRVDSVKGRLRNTFEATPDAPVSSVVVSLRGGKKGLFENSTNLCKGTHRALASFTGHNGKDRELRPALVATGCKGRAKKKR